MDQSNMKIDNKDLVFDILKRLPAKSLMRFVCVSKSWCHLITRDSSFIHNHLQFHTASKDPGALLLHPHRGNPKTKLVGLEYLSLETSEHTRVRFPWKRPWILNRNRMYDPYRDFFIVGHCNGLVCVSDAHRMIIWNPVIQRFKILPDTDDFNHELESINVYGRQSEVTTVIGFGFVPSSGNDDDADHESYYKVVRLTYTNVEASLIRPYYLTIGELYDSRTNSWTRIADDDLQCLCIKEFTKTGTFFNGSLYWLGDRHKTKEEEEASDNSYFPLYYAKITALNLVDEKFRNIKLPDDFDLKTNSGKKIAALGESQLALFGGDHRHNLLLTVWVMREDQNSWSKLCRINLRAGPLGFARNGEILMKMAYSQLILFDPKLQEPCHFRDLGFYVDDAIDYVQSLLLLDGEQSEEEEEPKNDEETKRQAEEVNEEDELEAEGMFQLFD